MLIGWNLPGAPGTKVQPGPAFAAAQQHLGEGEVVIGVAQLQARWGKEGARTILDTCRTRVFLPGSSDPETLEMASKLCATMAAHERGHVHDTGHAIMTEDMIRQLGQGPGRWHDQEGHPFHPEQVRVLQAARQARRRQGAGDHRDPAQGQQQAEEAGHRDRQPRHPVAEPRVVPAVTRDHRGGGEPAAEHDGRGPGQQRRAPPAQARTAPLYSTTQVAAAIAAVAAMVITHR